MNSGLVVGNKSCYVSFDTFMIPIIYAHEHSFEFGHLLRLPSRRIPFFLSHGICMQCCVLVLWEGAHGFRICTVDQEGIGWMFVAGED